MHRVGLIGLGAMGMPMGRNLLKAGFELTVWARRPESATEILAEGAVWAASPRELAERSDVVVLMVTNSPDVQQLVLDAGVLDGAAPGSVIVDMSTIAPAVSRSLAAACAARNVTFLDAPVSGGTQGAAAGTLTIMVGGEAESLERVRPVLDAMGARIFHVGPSGAGEVVKLVNNVLVGVIAAATAEALVLGVKAGGDAEVIAQVVGASTGASWQLANQFPLRAFNGSFRPGFMTNLLAKDLGLALDLGDEIGAPLFLTALTRQLYGEVQAKGYGADDYTSILRILESVAGVNVRTDPVAGG
jgi:3-hydroxyisobutyrate dehydrogenase